MVACQKCGAQVSSESVACQQCGATIGARTASGSSGPSLAFVQGLPGGGTMEQKMILGGGALAVIGTFLPFLVLQLPAGMGAGGSFSFIGTGLPGVVALLAAIALTGIGIMPSSTLLNTVGLALSSLVIGMLLYAFTASGFSPAGGDAGGLIGHGIGFYALALGFLTLAYVYVKRVPR